MKQKKTHLSIIRHNFAPSNNELSNLKLKMNMKQNKFFFGLASIAAAAFALSACSTEEPESNPKPQEENIISFTSTVNQTRATSDPQATSLNSSVYVGIFGVKNGTTDYTTNGDNNKYSVSGSNLTKVNKDMSFASSSVNIYAYAPYQDNWGYNTANSFSVNPDQSLDANYLASDLLRGVPDSNPVSETSSTINLTFTHMMARIKVTVTAATGSDIDVSGAQITINNTNLTTTFNPSTGALAESANTSNPGNINAGTGETNYAVVVPQTVTSGKNLITVVVGGKTYVAKLGADQTFVSGMSYEFGITVGTTADIPEVLMTLAAPSITGWGNGTESAITQFGIGDYIMADGSIVANSTITTSQKENVIGVIFSTEVSDADANEGYVGYAMSTVKTNGSWSSNDAKGNTPTSFENALADLGGLTNKEYLSLSSTLSKTGTNLSDWFAPSFGQTVQIINNLGGANITSSTTGVDFNKNQNGDMYNETSSVLTSINAYVTKLGKDALFNENNQVFSTCTENDNGSYHNFYYLKVTAANASAFGLGKSAGKFNNGSATNRQIIPCLAFKLP